MEHASALAKRQLPSETSGSTKPLLNSYEKMILQLVLRSRAALGLPALEPADAVVTVRAWAEILDGEVPENYLERAYVRAMRDKETGFALSAPELVQGFRSVCASERTAPRQDSNLLPGEVCQKCFGTGMYAPDKRDALGYRLPAQRCDHVAEITEDDLTAAGM